MSLADCRQAHDEGAALTFFAIDLGRTIVLLHDLLDHRQPQPHALDRLKSLEDPVLLISRDSHPMVTEGQLHLSGSIYDTDRNLSSVGAELYGIIEQSVNSPMSTTIKKRLPNLFLTDNHSARRSRAGNSPKVFKPIAYESGESPTQNSDNVVHVGHYL